MQDTGGKIMRKMTKNFLAATIVAMLVVALRPEEKLFSYWSGESWEWQLPGLIPIAFEAMGWWRVLTIPLLAAMVLRAPRIEWCLAGTIQGLLWLSSPDVALRSLVPLLALLVASAVGARFLKLRLTGVRLIAKGLRVSCLTAGLVTEAFFPLMGIVTSIIALAMIEATSRILLSTKEIWEGVKEFFGGVKFLLS